MQSSKASAVSQQVSHHQTNSERLFEHFLPERVDCAEEQQNHQVFGIRNKAKLYMVFSVAKSTTRHRSQACMCMNSTRQATHQRISSPSPTTSDCMHAQQHYETVLSSMPSQSLGAHQRCGSAVKALPVVMTTIAFACGDAALLKSESELLILLGTSQVKS